MTRKEISEMANDPARAEEFKRLSNRGCLGCLGTLGGLVLFFCIFGWLMERNDPLHNASPEIRSAVEHQKYLDQKKELNDRLYGTPEQRAEDAAKKAAEDEYTHEPN